MLMPATAQEVVDRDDQSAVADSAALNDVHQEGNGQDWVQTLRLNLDHLLASNMFKTSQVGMMVYDLTADSVLYAHNERQLMRPASTMKVITAITALDRLGGAHQFSTDLCSQAPSTVSAASTPVSTLTTCVPSPSRYTRWVSTPFAARSLPTRA